MSRESTASISTTHAVRLIAGREIRERLRTKSFPILTGLLVLMILAIGVVAALIGDDKPETLEVGVTAPVPSDFDETLAQSASPFEREAEAEELADVEAARTALEDGDVDVVVVSDDAELLFADEIDEEVQAIVQQAWSGAEITQSLLDSGLTTDEVGEALTPTPLTAQSIDDNAEDTGLAVLTGTLTAVLLFLSLQMFGNYVLMGVIEEKSTAVVELLLARVRADQLLAGKVIGIGVVALIQFTSAVIAGLVALAISGTEVPSEIWSAVPMTIVWFLGGYAFYSTWFALAGSLVSRQEDAQAASAPILTAMVGAYLLVFFFGYVPDSTASAVLSVIPPVSPFLMPMRMAAGAASIVEVVVAVVLLLGATIAMWKVSARIYDQVLLRRGSRIPWREALFASSNR